ncbi:adenosine deaminase-like protein [Chelonus insularis]|uniref:adenosine deaminase-like protein n=1 Tax=Chelonus insularis TaxID=460826 RepID=UPI00158A3A93|nr:adenosine deaminase-like protein [Chelonus insularis]
MEEELQFCEKVPKIELHAHLNGSISLEKLKLLNDNDVPTLPQYEITSSTPLKQCFEVFKIAHTIVNNPLKVYEATLSVIEDFYKDNVIYLELRSTPRMIPDIMTKDVYIESVIKAIQTASLTFPKILVKFLISVNRAHGIENATENILSAIKYHEMYPEYVVGLDLSGDPSEGEAFLHLLERARNAGLKIAAHCAEVPNNDEVEDILNFKPDRLGHCTHIHPDLNGSNELFEQLLTSKIPIELCITSNIKCQTVSDYSKHQFNYFYKANHPICIATDDKSVFNTTLSKEFQIIKTHFKLSSKELIKLSLAAVDYSFATNNEKEKLRQIIKNFTYLE